jgi:RimJ/RimL family protein N-acetyltransferase
MLGILKSDQVMGCNIEFRNTLVSDAEFIYSLRVDPNRSKHISKTSSALTDQIKWLEVYEQSDDQAYFIIRCTSSQRNIGTVRIYDPINKPASSFCWGSWILSSEAPSSAAIESALMIYEYGFKHLGFTNSHFDVRKDNNSVWKFHERCGAKRVAETDIDIFYNLSSSAQREACKKYSRYLPEGIKVIQKYVY